MFLHVVFTKSLANIKTFLTHKIGRNKLIAHLVSDTEDLFNHIQNKPFHVNNDIDQN